MASSIAIGAVAATCVLAFTAPASAAGSSQAKEGLGTATNFAVLGGSKVTNTGPSQISGDVGISPKSSITGFPPATVTNGTVHITDAAAASAQADAATAFGDLAGRTPATPESADLGGMTLKPGVYSGPTLSITGTLTLDAEQNPDAVFIFQAGSALDAAVSSSVVLLNGASACNVFWQVGTSATLHTNAHFAGTVIAGASITANTGASVQGRLLATAAVTLGNNVITRPACTTYPAGAVPVAAPGSPSTTPSSTAPTSSGPASGSPSAGAPSTGASGSTTSPTKTQAPTSSSTGAPVATGLSPTTGPSAGGTAVIVSGQGFRAGHTTVTIGGTTVPARLVTVLSSTRLTFTTTAHPGGTVQLTVTTTHGRSNRLTYTFTTTTTTTTTTLRTTTTTASTGAPTGLLIEMAALLLVAGYALSVGARRRTIGRHRH